MLYEVITAVVEQGCQAAGVVVVAVTEHDTVGLAKVDIERRRIGQQQFTLAGIKEKMPVAGVDPEGKAVLRLQARTGFIVNENGDADLPGLV